MVKQARPKITIVETQISKIDVKKHMNPPKNNGHFLMTSIMFSIAFGIFFLIFITCFVYCFRKRKLAAIRKQEKKEVDSDPSNLMSVFSPPTSPKKEPDLR